MKCKKYKYLLFFIVLFFIPLFSGADEEVFPYGALSISQGDDATASKLVDLAIYGTAGEFEINRMRFSNDGDTWSDWEEYAAAREDWKITAISYGGDTVDGIKRVYAQLMDEDDKVSAIFSDSIEYDTTPPATTADPQEGIFSYMRVIALETSEDNCTIYYTLDGTEPTTESNVYSGPIALMVQRTIKFFAVDDVGNVESVKTQDFNFFRIVTVPAMNAPAHIRQFDLTGELEDKEQDGVLFAFDDESFRGGANITTGDVDGDGQDEIIVGVGSAMGPIVEIYDKDGVKKGVDLQTHHSNYKGGVDVAAGDLDGDGIAEIITVNTSVTETDRDVARVKVYKLDNSLVVEFNAFGSAIAGGRVTVGDIDKDGELEIIVAANRHGGPIVRAFEADGSVRPTQFFTYHTDYRGGIDIAAGDIHGDGKDEIAVVPLAGELSRVKVYRWRDDQYIEGEFIAFDDWEVGGNIDMADIDQDGKDEVIVGTQYNGFPRVKAFEYDGTAIETLDFYAYAEEYKIGVSQAVLSF